MTHCCGAALWVPKARDWPAIRFDPANLKGKRENGKVSGPHGMMDVSADGRCGKKDIEG